MKSLSCADQCELKLGTLYLMIVSNAFNLHICLHLLQRCCFSETAVQFLETSFSKHLSPSCSGRNHIVSGKIKAFSLFLWKDWLKFLSHFAVNVSPTNPQVGIQVSLVFCQMLFEPWQLRIRPSALWFGWDANPIAPLHSFEPKTWRNHFVPGGGSLGNKGTSQQSQAAHLLFTALQPPGICCVLFHWGAWKGRCL